jgi:hypothetical protein
MGRYATALATFAVLVIGTSVLSPSYATTITYEAVGTLGGLPVEAKATFTTGNGTIDVTIINLQANPTSITQNVSDLIFTISTGQTSGSILSSSALERSVASNGTYSDGSVVSSGWALSTVGTDLRLAVTGTPTSPEHTLIGDPGSAGLYSNANSSIAGSNPHNPFLTGPLTFALSIPGVTTDSTITAATFSFGTSTATLPGTTIIPEPTPILLLGFGLVGLGLWRRQRREAA